MTGLKITAEFTEKELQTEDTNDYSGLTPPSGATQIGTNFRLISPAGITIHNNTSTTDLDMYPETLATFEMNLQLDSASNVVQGLYQLRRSRYWCDVNGDVVEAIDVVDYEVTLDFLAPTPGLDITIDYFTPLLKSVDTTNYVVGGVTPTITRDNRIVHSNALDPNLPDTVSTGPVVQTSTFGGEVGGLEYVFKLTSDLEYEYTAAIPFTTVSGTSPTPQTSTDETLFIVTEIALQKKKDIDNPQYICDVFCSLKSLYERYQDAKCSNATEANKALTPFLAASAISQLMRDAYFCGKTDLVGEYRDVIVKLSGGTDDCNCCDDDGPTIIQGLGVSGENTVVVGVDGETVVSYDGSYTYTVGLADEILELINALTFNITSIDNSIAVTTTTVNGVTTFNLSLGSLLTINRLDTESRFQFSSVALPVVSIENQGLKGTIFQAVTQTAPDTFIAVDPDYITDLTTYLNNPLRFIVDNFLSGDPEDFFVEAAIVNTKENDVLINFPVDAQIQFHDDGVAYLLFRREDGTLITGAWAGENIRESLYVKITFTA